MKCFHTRALGPSEVVKLQNQSRSAQDLLDLMKPKPLSTIDYYRSQNIYKRAPQPS